MSYGFTFDEEMRDRLTKATLKYEQDKSSRAALNAVIMDIQRPLIEKLDSISDILKGNNYV